jgi:5-methylthioadenosine/S-adenosylhomocysteine deaminase
MATLEGAAALGIDAMTGSLLPGKWADLCAIRIDDWTSQPCYCPASHLVHVAGREAVSHVWVAGRLRLCEGAPVGISPQELIEIADSWHNPRRLRSLDP